MLQRDMILVHLDVLADFFFFFLRGSVAFNLENIQIRVIHLHPDPIQDTLWVATSVALGEGLQLGHRRAFSK
jgi:hypothetical protein